MSNIRKSGRFYSHMEYTNSTFSPVLRRIANRLPPNERKPTRQKSDRRHYNVLVSDDDALALLRRIRKGERIASVAREAGIASNTLRQWHMGLMRPHLARLLDMEAAA